MMKKRVIPYLSVAFFAISMLWSCQWHTIEPVVIDTPAEVSFSTDLEPIFDSKCGSCHNSGNRNFTTGNAYQSLINGGYVDTNNPESSSVYTTMKDDQHPSASGTFSQSELAFLLAWIEQGALDN